MALIEISSLKKSFGELQVLKQITFDIEKKRCRRCHRTIRFW